MRLALLGPSYPFKGGIAQYTTQLYRELEARHDTLFISFKRQYPDWLYPGQTDRDVDSTDLVEKRAIPLLDSLNPVTWYRAAMRIRDFQPEVVIFPWWVMFWAPQFIFMILVLRTRAKQARIIFLCHNVTAHEPSWLSRVLTRITLGLGDAFLVQSEQDERELGDLLDSPRIMRVEHPNYAVEDSDLWSRQQAKDKLGLEGDVLLFFGFIRPYKGLHTLLEAMPLVLQKRPCTLLIAGEVWGDQEEYARHIEQLGIGDSIRWEQRYIPQAQVPEYFCASDLVVLPYLSATGSGVVKLAFSHHRPVVVTGVGSLPTDVKEGRSGYIVPAGDPNALADAILAYLERGQREQVESYIADDVKRFSWEQVVLGIEALRDEMLSDS